MTKAQADVSGAEASLESVKAQLAKAQADLRVADVRFQRRLALYAKSLVAKEDCDMTQATYDSDLATVQAVRAQIKSAEDRERDRTADGCRRENEKHTDPVSGRGGDAAVFGGTLGIAAGIGASVLISHFAGWTTHTGINANSHRILFLWACRYCFGCYPARKAALLNPIEALR